jgi:hypothetical protein
MRKFFLICLLITGCLITMAPTYYNGSGKVYYDPNYEFNIPIGQNGTTTKYITQTGISKVSDLPYWNINSIAPTTVSLTAAAATKSITAATKANPCKITSSTHGYSTNDYVYISGIVGMTELNNKIYQITKFDNDSYTLNNIDSTNYTTYGSVGTSRKVVPVSVDINTSTAKLSIVNCSTGATVRVDYESIENRPFIVDLNEYYDWTDSNIKNRITKILLTEIGAGTTPTIVVRQEK